MCAVVFSVVTNTQPASRRPSSQAANRPSSACVLPQRAVATSSKSLLDSIRSIRESWESGRHACARSKRADAPVSHFSQVYEYPTAGCCGFLSDWRSIFSGILVLVSPIPEPLPAPIFAAAFCLSFCQRDTAPGTVLAHCLQ